MAIGLILHIRYLKHSSQHPSEKDVSVQVRKLRLKDNVRFALTTQLVAGAAGSQPPELCHCSVKGRKEREMQPLVPFKDRTLILWMFLEERKQKRP